jgi:DNA-directed RNA polymerase specialized sigma24 family protein
VDGRQDDVLLMRAIPGGEARAFEEFVRRYQKRFYRMLWLFARPRRKPRRRPGRLHPSTGRASAGPQAQPFTWSYRILVNHCIDLIRKRRLRGPSPRR